MNFHTFPKKKRRLVLRTFTCVHCGKTVRVTRPYDIRRYFCSYTCSLLYKQQHAKSSLDF